LKTTYSEKFLSFSLAAAALQPAGYSTILAVAENTACQQVMMKNGNMLE